MSEAENAQRAATIAVLVENEIRDMFDIRFSDLPLDYSGTFYMEGEVIKGPMCNYTIIKQ